MFFTVFYLNFFLTCLKIISNILTGNYNFLKTLSIQKFMKCSDLPLMRCIIYLMKEAKERKRKAEMGWDEEDLVSLWLINLDLVNQIVKSKEFLYSFRKAILFEETAALCCF